MIHPHLKLKYTSSVTFLEPAACMNKFCAGSSSAWDVKSPLMLLCSFTCIFQGDHIAGDSSDDDDEEDMETEEDFHYAMEEDHRYDIKSLFY